MDQTRVLEGELTVNSLMTSNPVAVPAGTPVSRVAEILGRSRMRHVLVNDEQGRFVGVISSNDLLRHMSDAIDENDWGYRNRTVESLMTTNFLASSPKAGAELLAPMIMSGSIQCMPVLEGDRLVGVLTPDDLLLSWSRIHPMLREAAQDCVTELASRATFERRLQEEWHRADRTRGMLSLIIVDLDRFKEINDTCGHQAGDAVLQMVSSCLRRTLRSYDTIARFGGDEFAAICVDCDREKVVHPIRRLQEAIKSISVPSASGRHTVTLSIGIAVIHSGFEHRTPQDLIALADACLYQAKRSGRDGAFLSELRSDTSDVPEDLAAYEANTAPVLV